MHSFHLASSFSPAGDQPAAIEALISGIQAQKKSQVLLGVTGSGKTFTMAHTIQRLNRPTLIMAPNKTLAAQLFSEMKGFFPHNAVEYFVSYYDYYRPEAYIPTSDLYIEKDAAINEHIERFRHSATRALLERRDVIIVASVSCIYGLGAVESYREMALSLKLGEEHSVPDLCRHLVMLQYKRNDISFVRGTFRVRGCHIDLFPAHYENRAWRIAFLGDEIDEITEIDTLTGEKTSSLSKVTIYPNSHYVTPGPTVQQAIKSIREELACRLEEFMGQGKLLEAQRLKERVAHDLEALATMGFCPGIENYSRHLTGRVSGSPPPTLFEYLPKDALLIVDESHVSVPQIRGMSIGDSVRKETLSTYGFRLPSCKDNRPLTFVEWDAMRPQTLFVSATPGPWECATVSGEMVEQILRPTGLLDPICTVFPTENQIDHLVDEVRRVISDGGRVLITTLTKKMAEALSEFLEEIGFLVRYMHADIDTLERIQILQDLREGIIDIVVGINLLREGLDIPECQLVAILDADKEGYLRSKTSLIQIIGRAARHPKGHVFLYADTMTRSLQGALEETMRRRQKQQEYNARHGITPQMVKNTRKNVLIENLSDEKKEKRTEGKSPPKEVPVDALRRKMKKAVQTLDFERAAELRDQIRKRETKTQTS